MAEAARSFVDIDELLEKAGEKIAATISVEAAFITSGAAAGLAVAAAACMAGADPQKAKQLPDSRGMKDEIVVLRCHRIHYDQAVRLSGARFVEVGFADWSAANDMEPFVTENTAAILYLAKGERARASIPADQVIAIAKAKNVPVIVDAADEVPPVSNLRRYTDLGADLVLFSGGKDIRGPQDSGLIIGKTEMIKACAVNGCPNYGIGRPMKISKEVVVGLVKAVELYLLQDFDQEMKIWERQRDYMVEKLKGTSHIRVTVSEPIAPGSPGSFYLPAAYVTFDEKKLGMSKDDIVDKLRTGNPGIVTGESSNGIILRAHMLQEGEEEQVVMRLLEILCR